MTRTGTEQQNQRMAALSVGLLALGLALASGPVRAEPSATAAWAFDLLARAEQWRPTMPLDFLPGAAKDRPLASAAQARIQAGYGRLSMHFEPNLGQTADEVKFMARGSGYTLFLTADESVLALHPNRPAADRADPHHRRPFGVEAVTPDIAPAVLGAVIRTRLEGATRNPEPQLEGLEKQPGISNYFLGNDPAKWRTNIPHYQRVRYPNVYPGIDLVYYGNPQRLEHDFIVAPGADPTVIQLAISGAEQATVNAEGDLVLKVAGGEVVQQAPKIYQVFDGQQQEVTGRYVLRDAVPGAMPTVSVAAEPTSSPLLIGFEVAQYDRKQPLVIDPVLVYSTYLGGSNKEWGRSIAVDGSGNAYVTGATYSTDFPTVNAKYPHLWGLDDAFVFKLSSDGQTVLYSTYLGGSYVDGGSSIAVDGSGNAYVTGGTSSTDFPTVNAKYPHLWGGPEDAFVFKLSSDGQTVRYSTYLGGSNEEWGRSIAVDGSGNAYVTGATYSTDFPTVNAKYPHLWGLDDAFVFKLSSDGQTVLYSTYLGGSNEEWGDGIAVNGSGDAYVTGGTSSTDFPTVNAKYPHLWGGPADAFVFKLSSDGQTVRYSTYLGGSNEDWGTSIAVDGSGDAYVTGGTSSTDFPTVNAKYPHLWGGPEDAFVFKLSSDGQTVRYSTYLGGSNKEWGRSIAVDGSGNAYVTGATYSTDFPTVNAKYPHLWGLDDAFVFKLSSDGQTVLYSTYLGGSYVDGGSSIAVDGSGNAYVMGITYSTDFPTVNAKYPHLWGAQDAFITKIADGGSPSVTLTVSVTGSGTVYSTPGGINCGSDCSESYAPETSIMLAATAASGYVFSGWGGACIGITTNYCTLTMEADKSVAAEFKTKTPEQTDPDRSTLGITCSTTDCSTTSTKAVLITHGYNATASDWIEDMAQAICRRLPATQYYSTRKADSLMSICSGNGWDVWTTDWRTMAFATSLLPPNAYVNAGIVGPQIGNLLKNFHYQYYHLIAHSAGSNLIQTATSVLAPFATIHETFLDAFDPFALLPASDHRHISEYYGTLATYVDNYVDTRTLLEGHLDTTDLHLANGYNIDVTPAGDGCGALGISCRHGRPYRFYLKSISENTYNDPYKDVDPVDKTGQMGFALSMEAGNSMNLLKNDKDAECRMDDSGNCSPVAKPTYGTLYYLPGAIGNTLVDTAVGTVNFAKGVGAKIFETLQFAVSVPPANSITVSGEAPAIAAMPTATPAWLVTQVTTTNSTNTLRFNWRFTSGGEGLLRVFVNENLVSQIDQRFVPLASTQPESVYVGELPAGTYRIAFRLDGYGANASGMTLTDVELGQRTFNSGGQASSGVFRAGTWYLDANGNGAWDGCGVDRCYVGSFGITGDLPVAGDWNGDGKAKVGVFRNGTWYLDYNGNGAWDGCGMERCYVGSFGITGDLPVAGDWNGDGKAKVGVFRNGTWYLDYNGNGAWDGCSIDRCYVGSFGIAGDLPAAGDWNGDGKTKIGVFRNGTWYLDYNGNGAWDGCGVDRCYVGSFGQTGDLPAAGDWNGDGKAKVGVFRNGTWFLDYNGNGAWDGCGVDRCYYGSFGQQGDLPVAGKW